MKDPTEDMTLRCDGADDDGCVVRYDRSSMGTTTLTPEGFLRFDAIASRSGIFTYYNDDGSIRYEYRPPEEVFKQDALDSFIGKPIINNHEQGVTPPITAENVKDYQVGTIGDNVRRDGNFVRLTGTIHAKEAVASVQAGRNALSLGYKMKLDMTPGTTPDGLRYDCIQRNITGNHLAIVNAGRAGAMAVIPLENRRDSADINDLPQPTQSSRSRIMKYNLDGVEVDAPETVVNALVSARTDAADKGSKLNTAQTELAAAKAATDTEKGRADALQTEVTTLKARDVEKEVRDGVDARVKLIEDATLVLDAAELKGKTEAEIRKAVITKVYPDMNLDGKSADYISGLFGAAVKSHDTQERRDAMARQRQASTVIPKDNADGAGAAPASGLEDAWKTPCSKSKK